ncbi:helix-turn-helix domain-containing protein [Devosia sp.]|uniref:winged helix-turn-helix transcriptional regulator n=1 Tax=Devosia sp. TaxID=1871048 RepID=UPI0032662C4E
MKPASYDGHDCRPVSEILGQISGKWTVLIITRLSQGSMRFSEIKREIGGISQKMLTSTLRDLEMDGYVTRTVTPTIPPRVDYELTELGHDLRGPLTAVGAWAVENRARVLEARRHYLDAHPDAVPSHTPHVGLLKQAAE